MKTERWSLNLIALTVMLLFSGSFYVTPVLAENEKTNDKIWQFEITPYLFASAMDGTAEMNGVSADVDMSFSDIWERLDKAFMFYFTARKGDWIYSFDAIYFKLEDEAASSWQGPLGNSNTAQLNVDATQEAYTLSVGRQVYNQKTKIDVFGVVRYTRLDTNLELALSTGADLLPNGSRSTSRKESWWDAAIAAQVISPISDKWDVVGYAEMGTGGSDFTYQLIAGVNWQFSDSLSAKMGYRYLYQDYQKDDFRWDMTTSGVYAGLGIKF